MRSNNNNNNNNTKNPPGPPSTGISTHNSNTVGNTNTHQRSVDQPQRTIQVRVGDPVAKSSSPEETAEYLKALANLGCAMAQSPSGYADHTQTAAAAAVLKGRSKSRDFPCTEKEMKALMNMFVEIMGLQMNTERLNTTTSTISTSGNVLKHAAAAATVVVSGTGNSAASAATLSASCRTTLETRGTSTTTNATLLSLGGIGTSSCITNGGGDCTPLGGWPEEFLHWSSSDTQLIPPRTLATSTLSGTVAADEHDKEIDAGAVVDEDDDDDPLPALEEIPYHERQATAAAAHVRVTVPDEDVGDNDDEDDNGTGDGTHTHRQNVKSSSNQPYDRSNSHNGDPTVVTGRQGIAPWDWEALERVAVEDALEHEERSRKVKKKWTANKKEKVNEAAIRQAEELLRTRHKLIDAWCSEVVGAFHAACASTDCRDLQDLLDNSLVWDEQESLESLQSHLSIFLPLLIPKNRSLVSKGHRARTLLSRYVMKWHVQLLMLPLPRNGLSVLHTVCWYGDECIVKDICQHWLELKQQVTTELEQQEKKKPPKSSKSQQCPAIDIPSLVIHSIDEPCSESGWTPLQYAALSGSVVCLETLLQAGARVGVRTNNTHTWSRGDGQGLTCLQLVQSVLDQKYGTAVETHGMAFQKLEKEFLKNVAERERYLFKLEYMLQRLQQLERCGYVRKSTEQIQRDVTALERRYEEQVRQRLKTMKAEPANDASSNKGSIGDAKSLKTKKKKKKSTTGSTLPSDGGSSGSSRMIPDDIQPVPTAKKAEANDPLVAALVGMGFSRTQILEGIKACGGIDHATADTVIAWIFGQHESEQLPLVEEEKLQVRDDMVDSWNQVTKAKVVEQSGSAASKKGTDSSTGAHNKKGNSKKEELRRLNREWNVRTRQRQESEFMKPKEAPVSQATRPPVHTHRSNRQVSTNRQSTLPMNSAAQKMEAFDSSWINEGGASTTVSSIEHGSIEIFNDDATISTLGSFQTRCPPTHSQLSFSRSASFGPASAVNETQTGDPWGMSVKELLALPLTDQAPIGPPPGMSQAMTTVSDLASSAAEMGQQELACTSDPFLGVTQPHPPFTQVLRTGFQPDHNFVLSPGGSSLSNTAAPFLHPSAAPGVSAPPTVPGLQAHLGFPAQHVSPAFFQNQQTLESSVIDSFLTAGLVPSTLWDSPRDTSRILGNIVPASPEDYRSDVVDTTEDEKRRYLWESGQNLGGSIW